MCPLTGRPRFNAAARIAWLRASPSHTCTKSIFSPSATASGHASKIPPILSAVRSPPAVSKRRRGRRHRARHGEEDVERRRARVREHPLDALAVADIADLVAVAEDRRGAVEQRRLGIGAGGHHAALDVDMRIDQAGGENRTGAVEDVGAAVARARAGRLHRGNAPARHPDLAIRQDALGIRRERAHPRDHRLRRLPPGGDGRQRAGHAVQRRHREAVHGAPLVRDGAEISTTRAPRRNRRAGP